MAIVETDREVQALKTRVRELEDESPGTPAARLAWFIPELHKRLPIKRHLSRPAELQFLEALDALKARVAELEGNLQARMGEIGCAIEHWRTKSVELRARLDKAEVAENELLIIKNSLRWWPIAEWESTLPETDKQREVAMDLGFYRPALRGIEPAYLSREQVTKKGWTHFRPVLPGPEGAPCR